MLVEWQLPKKRRKVKRKRVQEDYKEIIDLVDQARYDNSEAAVNEIVSIMQSYIKALCRKYITSIAGLSLDDIESECVIALITKAIPDFNFKKGKFKTFSVLCMERHLLSIIKANAQQKNSTLNKSVSIDKIKYHSDGEATTLKNIIANNDIAIDEQVYNKEERTIMVKKLAEVLSPLEKDVFDLYIQKYRYSEIVEILKSKYKRITCRSVDNSVQRIKGKARDIADELG